MRNPSYLESLADLSETLEQLSKQTLSVQTRGILQKARQRLAQLSRELSEKPQENCSSEPFLRDSDRSHPLCLH